MTPAIHTAQFSRDGDDLRARIAAERRPKPVGRPWVTLNMVTSIDGATAVDGVSGQLGGDGDHAMFGALRAMADGIVVASGTARAENYGPARMDPTVRTERVARGQEPDPFVAVVSASLRIDGRTRLFDPDQSQADDRRPIVLTTSDSPEPDRTRLAAVADVMLAGEGRVDLAAGLAALEAAGANVVMLEGGPRLNAQFLADGLIDEVTVTLAPTLVGGTSRRMLDGDSDAHSPVGFTLDRVLRSGNELFLRYLRAEA